MGIAIPAWYVAPCGASGGFVRRSSGSRRWLNYAAASQLNLIGRGTFLRRRRGKLRDLSSALPHNRREFTQPFQFRLRRLLLGTFQQHHQPL